MIRTCCCNNFLKIRINLYEGVFMNHIILGLICGLSFGVLDVLVMLPMKFEDNRKKIEALSGAFMERFMIGFIIPNIKLGIPEVYSGGIIGLGLSIPTSIITRAYLPINIIGLIGGLVIGYLTIIIH
jgi:hypothetical protein